jgi:SAM-dependent methyltransferase
MNMQNHSLSVEGGLPATSAMTNESCPNCDAANMTVFYEIRRVPVHSCLLVPDSGEARRYPCGDIRLAYCSGCGFISNLLFNATLQDYTAGYEESQHHSTHFNAFAKRLAGQWIDDYQIHNKTILEIGCGKGEFLDLFCQLGGNKGIGIDPACDPSRLSDAANKRIRFIRDNYSPEYSDLQADVVCCRHTLEHISSTGKFVEELRRSLGDRHDTIVLFELPDVSQILRENAFWDIYFEHCSYFTAGSLARLFRRNSFDVIDLRREYDDQYLTLAARPSAQPTQPRLDLEHDLAQTVSEITSFQSTCPDQIRFWQDRLRQFAIDGQKVVAWGGGSKCVSFCTTLGIGDEMSYAVDINPRKSGKFLPGTGHCIYSPDYLQQDPPDVVIAMNPVYCNEIQADLDRLGVGARLLTL